MSRSVVWQKVTDVCGQRVPFMPMRGEQAESDQTELLLFLVLAVAYSDTP
jgi:hypothetical protein